MQNPPARLFDTHAHVFTSDVDRYPVDLYHARENTESLRDRVMNHPVTAEHVLELWDRFDVTGGVAVQYNSVYKTDNSYTLDMTDRYADRMSAVLILKATEPSTPAKLRDLASRHNVSGLRLFGYLDKDGAAPWLDSPNALRSWDVVAECGLAMVLMYAPGVPSFEALRRIIALARRYPETAIVLDHCGWPGLEHGVTGTIGAEHLELVDVPNVHFKFTEINVDRFAEPGVDHAQFVRLLADTYGADRIMWGSDYGNTKGAEYGDMISRAINAASLLSEAERDKFLYSNGAQLFSRNA